jgi:hypothetical protein
VRGQAVLVSSSRSPSSSSSVSSSSSSTFIVVVIITNITLRPPPLGLPEPIKLILNLPFSRSAWDNDKTRVIEYIEGTSLYYGSTIALQAHHGGFLGFDSHTRCNAMVTNGRQPNVLFKVWHFVCGTRSLGMLL